MSFFQYNGVVLSLTKINYIDKVVIYSDDNTEYRHTLVTIDINCVYNPAATSYSYQTGQATPAFAPETENAIRAYLSVPRRGLLFSEGGIPIISIAANPTTGDAIDAENGPLPIKCSIQRIIGAQTFFVNYVIKTALIECPVGTTIPALSSNRYSRTETINDQYMSIITTAGRATFHSSVLSFLAQDADEFRTWIIPPPLKGFKRSSVIVNIESTGINIDWTVVDMQVVRDLGDYFISGTATGAGIVKIEGLFGMSTNHQGSMGLAVNGTRSRMTLRAWGTTASSNWNMISFLLKLASDKLPVGQPNAIFTEFNVAESIMDSYVEVTLGYFRYPNMPANANVDPFGAMPIKDAFKRGYDRLDWQGINPAPPYAAGTRGTAAGLMAVSAFRRSCEIQKDPVHGDITGTIADDYQLPYDWTGDYLGVHVQLVDDLPSSQPFYRVQNANSINLVYEIFSTYYGKSHRKQLGKSTPVSNSGTSPTPTPTPPSPSPTSTLAPRSHSYRNNHRSLTPMPLTGLPSSRDSSGSSGSSGSQSNQTCEIVTLWQSTSVRSVQWTVERIGATPEVPSPASLDSNFVLSESSITPVGVELMGDGITRIYRVSGQYDYFAKDVVAAGLEIPFDVPGWIALDRGTDAIKDYNQNFISNSGTSGA